MSRWIVALGLVALAVGGCHKKKKAAPPPAPDAAPVAPGELRGGNYVISDYQVSVVPGQPTPTDGGTP